MGLFDTLIGKAKAEGSAFVKVAEAEASAIEAKARIVTIDLANKAKNVVIDGLEKEVTRVHSDVDATKGRIAAVLAKL